MYPSKPNSNAAGASDENSATSKLTAPSSAPGEKYGPPSTEFNSHAGSPSASLLPPSPYNPNVPNMEPPPYSSVVAQDSSDWKNRSNSFSGGDQFRPYPPTTGPVNTSKSTSGLNNTAPYPSGPEPTSQAPYPPTQYPTQAPYPTGPGSAHEIGRAPYPSGPGLGPAITSQPPYPAGPGYIPGPASQAPYPTGSMPMPAPIDQQRHIGFTAPITEEPKSYSTGAYAGLGQGQPNEFPMNGNQAGQPGVIYPTESGGHQYVPNQYVPNQYVPNQYGQQQPATTNTIYVVEKAPQQNTTDDDCATLACCLACCYCFCECAKLCAECNDS